MSTKEQRQFMKRVKKQNDSIDSLNGEKEDNFPMKINYIPPMPASAKGDYYLLLSWFGHVALKLICFDSTRPYARYDEVIS